MVNCETKTSVMIRFETFSLLCLVLNLILHLDSVRTLTGHVCRRQKEETYRVSTNKAFLCSERYTTSCGHLDWRRCTRYRVQTCYTPSERYAKRYREVEECCPGWLEAAGSCNIPVCHGLCQNGGVCSDTGAVPHCSCLPGFYGDSCQLRQNNPIDTPPSGTPPSFPTENNGVPAWMVPVVVATSVLGVAVVGVFGFCLFRRSLSTTRPTISPMTVAATGTSATIPSQSGPFSRLERAHQLMTPSAPSYEESTGVAR